MPTSRNSSAGSSLIKKSAADGSQLKKRQSSTKSNKNRPSCTLKISAVITRLLFIFHTAVAFWRVWLVYPPIYMYFLAIGIGCLLVEMVFTIAVRHGQEYKWLCPSVFFYLLSVVPCLWLLEIAQLNGFAELPVHAGGCNLSGYGGLPVLTSTNASANMSLNMRRNRRDLKYSSMIKDATTETLWNNNKAKDENDKNNSQDFTLKSGIPKNERKRNFGRENTVVIKFTTRAPNSTTLSTTETTEMLNKHITKDQLTTQKVIKSFVPTDNDINLNTHVSTKYNATHRSAFDTIGSSITDFGKNTLDLFKDTTHKVDEILKQLDPENWLLALHQVLLFVLVIGRWLLPKGEITRDQLSQLLLVFIGVGADILEFVTETMDNDVFKVRCNWTLHFIIYSVWSWSLLQFTLVLTAAKSRKSRVAFSNNRVVLMSKRKNCCTNTIFNNADLWGIVVTMMLQDVPFLAFRLYMMVVYRQIHQMMIFFTGKNILVVMLQLYRLVVLQIQHKSAKPDEVNDSELQPLKGTLLRMARSRNARSVSDRDIKNASFKSKPDGSVVVKLHLEREEKQN